ncbi:PD40 domain-containing protein [Candidatus Micrarchaeota archaeon]|nr:PD40 domain-containing protein [Candidatus Micrarchaeota archaeon]
MKHYIPLFLMVLLLVAGCTGNQTSPGHPANSPPQVPSSPTPPSQPAPQTVPHEGKWGIYSLDLATQDVELIYSTDEEMYSSALRLNPAGNTFVFAQKTGENADENSEVFTINSDGTNLQRITTNSYWDLYPAWSPDGNEIAFLSKRENDLDIYVMDSNGSNQMKLYDSGSHDADVDWAGDKIVFTSGFKIWTINGDGTSPAQVTNPANAGQWGTSNLPIGDYDPRLSTDGRRIVFERLEDPNTAHGGYNLFVINSDGSSETRLTENGYAQGLASWSNSGTKLVYVVAAIGNEGKYDLYMINADGTENRDITPSYFSPDFLCHSSIFSKDDSKIYFIGQWWE